MIKITTNLLSALIVLFATLFFKSLFANNAPTLLQNKTEKKEKLREEELVTKEYNIDELMINKFINLELVQSIFPKLQVMVMLIKKHYQFQYLKIK